MDTALDVRSLPKVELHLHLDCSLSYEAVSRLDPRVKREEYERDFIAPPKCHDLTDFLSRAPREIALMQTEEALRVATADVVAQMARDGVLYGEIRFAPLLHTREGLATEQVVGVVDEALTAAVTAAGIDGRLILCTLRHFTTAQSLETARLVRQFQGRRVAALDLAGDEAGYPIEPHIPAFEYAIAHGLGRTAHAGEARGADSVWETLRHVRPSRLGHGIRSIEDPRLIEHLQQQQIHLEVCPTCNVQIDLYPTYADHPIDRLYRQGIPVGVNTDTRTITHVTLAQEYEKLRDTFGWGPEQFLACNLQAIRAAFAPATVKEELAARLRAAYEAIM